MANARALTIQAGIRTEIADADTVLLGAGIDRAVAGALAIGGTTATSLSVNTAGQLTQILGTLTVDQATTLTGQLDANADVNLGNAATDTVSMIGEIDTDVAFINTANRRIDIADSTAVGVAGRNLTVASGGGAPAQGATPGGIGGESSLPGGQGGVGTATLAAGAGGGIIISGGGAGVDNGGGGASGGGTALRGGAATGAGTDGSLDLGDANTSVINVGNGTDNPVTTFLGSGDVRISSQLRLAERTGDPTNVANTGFIYTKDVSAVTEMFYQDSGGAILQITSGGGLKDAIAPASTPVVDRGMLYWSGTAGTTVHDETTPPTVQSNGDMRFGAALAALQSSSSVDLVSERSGGIATLGDAANAGSQIITAGACDLGAGGVAQKIRIFTDRMEFNIPGSTFKAATGTYRSQKNTSWRNRNSANAADITVWETNASDELLLGVGTAAIEFGDATTNPTYTFLGSGEVIIDGDALTLTEQVADPGLTANAGKLYTKDVSTVTELFYQASDGTVTQVTPPAAGADITIADNTSGAFRVHEAANDYIRVNTTDASEAIILGNATTNPDLTQLGSGQVTLNGPLDANGAVNLGNAAADTISIIGEVDTDIVFITAVARRIDIAQSASETAGAALTVAAGEGGNAAAAAVGGVGGASSFVGAAGGAASATFGAGAGGAGNLTGGAGGAGSAAQVAGAGAAVTVAGGAAGADGGGGGANGGPTAVRGGASTGAGTDGALDLGDADTSAINIGNATDNPVTTFLGTGDVRIGSQLRFAERTGDPSSVANTGFVYTKDISTVTELFYEDSTGAVIQITSGGSVSGGSDIAITDNVANAFRVHEAANDYIVVDTLNAAEVVDFGNATTNPGFNFLGSGAVNVVGELQADGGVGRSSAGTLLVGTDAESTAITIGSVGVTTTIAGDLQVDGAETVTGASTFTDNATFNGNVTFGNASTDTVQFGATDATGSRIGPAGSPNMHFVASVAHTIDIDQSANETVGAALTVTAGEGGDAAAAAVGGAGGASNFVGAVGGAASATFGGGAGGAGNFAGGVGGAGTATQAAGAGGPVAITGGTAGAALAGGGNNGGPVTIDGGTPTGAGTAGSVTIGGTTAATVTVTLADNILGVFVIQEGANAYLDITTSNGGEQITLGNATTNPDLSQLGSGQVSFAGNVNATNGLDVTTAALTAAVGLTVSGGVFTFTGSNVDLDPTGTFALDMDAAQTATVTVADSLASALLIQEGANAYLDITTVIAAEAITFGNATTNPSYTFLGSGEVIIDGDALTLTEQAADPGATANTGKIYTKDDATVTELFYQASDGTVTQLTPVAGGNAPRTVVTATASENIAAGAPVNFHDSAGSPRIQEGDANGAGTRPNTVGVALAAILSAASGDVVVAGEVDVPDAQWDALPAVGDVGEPAYVSATIGNLTLVAPAGGSTVLRVGYITRGGTGAVKVVVNVGEPVKTQ